MPSSEGKLLLLVYMVISGSSTPPNIVLFLCSFSLWNSSLALDPAEEYKMDNKQRGLALIFNQERFFWRLGLNDRHGTNADRYNLEKRYHFPARCCIEGTLYSATVWLGTCLYLFSDCKSFLHLSFRLKELNFEVQAYDNYKQVEVLDKISEGKQMHDSLLFWIMQSSDPTRDMLQYTQTHLTNTWCPTSCRGQPFRRRLLFARLPEPRREWSRLHIRWQDQHSGYHIAVQRRQVQEPRRKAKDLYITGTCKQNPVKSIRIWQHARLCVFNGDL